MPKIRQLSFDTFDQVVDDMQSLQAGGYSRAGNWCLTEMADHFIKTINLGFHEGMKPYPWLLRATIGKLITEYIIRTGHMPSWVQAPLEVVPVKASEDDPVTIDACCKALRAAHDFQGPLCPHPVCLGLSLPKWKRLMLVHCAHHLSFLAPAAGGSDRST